MALGRGIKHRKGSREKKGKKKRVDEGGGREGKEPEKEGWRDLCLKVGDLHPLRIPDLRGIEATGMVYTVYFLKFSSLLAKYA